ncbi:unnamed protein product, partial [Vitis vinifera]
MTRARRRREGLRTSKSGSRRHSRRDYYQLRNSRV